MEGPPVGPEPGLLRGHLAPGGHGQGEGGDELQGPGGGEGPHLVPLPAQEAEEVGAFTAATPVTATRTRATARYSSRSTG